MATDTAPPLPAGPPDPPAPAADGSVPAPAGDTGIMAALMAAVEPARPVTAPGAGARPEGDDPAAKADPDGAVDRSSPGYTSAAVKAPEDLVGADSDAAGARHKEGVIKTLLRAGATRWAKGGGAANKRLDVAKAQAAAHQVKETRTTTVMKSSGIPTRSSSGGTGGGGQGSTGKNTGGSGRNSSRNGSAGAGRGGNGAGSGSGGRGSSGSNGGNSSSGRGSSGSNNGGESGKSRGPGDDSDGASSKNSGAQKTGEAAGKGKVGGSAGNSGASGKDGGNGKPGENGKAGASGKGGGSGSGGSSGGRSPDSKTKDGKDQGPKDSTGKCPKADLEKRGGSSPGSGSAGSGGKSGTSGKDGKSGPAGGGSAGGGPTGSDRTPLQRSRETGHGDGSAIRNVVDHVQAYAKGAKDGYQDKREENGKEHARLDKAHDRHRTKQQEPKQDDPQQQGTKVAGPDGQTLVIAPPDEKDDGMSTDVKPLLVKEIDPNTLTLGTEGAAGSVSRKELRNFKQYERKLEAKENHLVKVADACKSLEAAAEDESRDCQQLAEQAKAVEGGEKLAAKLSRLADSAKAQATEAAELRKRAQRAAEMCQVVLTNIGTRYAPLYKAVVDSDETKPAELRFYNDKGSYATAA
ncbi:hypothetical protein [Streptomyces sp. NPDC055107]